MADTPERDDRTKHIAALCSRCDTAFVAVTLKPGGSPIEVVTARLTNLSCPECGSTKKFGWLVGPRHAEAVARLRREAALD